MLECKLTFKENGKRVTVSPEEVVFFESDGHYVVLHMKDTSEHRIRCTMSALGRMLDNNTFVRIHRGIVVNLACAENIDSKGVWLKWGYGIVPVSRMRRENVNAAFDIYCNLL